MLDTNKGSHLILKLIDILSQWSYPVGVEGFLDVFHLQIMHGWR
jgi:hypothetical protein